MPLVSSKNIFNDSILNHISIGTNEKIRELV